MLALGVRKVERHRWVVVEDGQGNRMRVSAQPKKNPRSHGLLIIFDDPGEHFKIVRESLLLRAKERDEPVSA